MSDKTNRAKKWSKRNKLITLTLVVATVVVFTYTYFLEQYPKNLLRILDHFEEVNEVKVTAMDGETYLMPNPESYVEDNPLAYISQETKKDIQKFEKQPIFKIDYATPEGYLYGVQILRMRKDESFEITEALKDAVFEIEGDRYMIYWAKYKTVFFEHARTKELVAELLKEIKVEK